MAEETGTTGTLEAPAAPPTTPPAVPPASTGSWHERLPEALRHDKTLRDFKDEGALAQSYVELKKWQSGALKLPGKDAKPEEIAAYREKIGVPKTPEGYDLSPLAGLDIDMQRAPAFLQHAHAAGIPQEAAIATIKWAFDREKHARAQANEANLKALDGLADEMGKGEFDRRAQLVERTLSRAPNGKTLTERLKGLGFDNDPELFKFVSWVGEQFAEDGIIDGRVEGVGTSDQIKDRIAAIRAEIATEMKKGDTPRLRDLNAQMEEQYKLLHQGR